MTEQAEKPAAPRPAPGRRNKRLIAAVVVLLPLLAGLDACLIEPYWIEVTRHDVGAGPREITVLHLTDIHFTRRGSREDRVLEIATEARPDLIVITGDSILRNYDREEFTAFLSELSAPLGVFACPGNWEDWVGDSVYACYERAGVRVLRDVAVSIADGNLELLGLSSATPAFPPPGDAKFTLALCHYPAVLPVASQAGVEVLLAGHTHGGQVRLPFIGSLHLPFDSGGYEAGWYEEGGCRMYISRGVGTSVLPVRFLCRPEVAIHRIRYEP